MFFNFFKTPSVRKFEHIPIYWDQEKEEREERRERIRQEIENEHGNPNMPARPTLRRGFLSEQRKGKVQSSQSGTIRLAIIIVLVVGALSYMFR